MLKVAQKQRPNNNGCKYLSHNNNINNNNNNNTNNNNTNNKQYNTERTDRRPNANC